MTNISAAVFDAATDHACIEFPPVTDIPAAKAAARAELAAAMATTSVTITVCPPAQLEVVGSDDSSAEDAPPEQANGNNPRMAVKGEWIGDEFFPETPQHWLDKIARRQAIGDGWDGRAANDNHEPLPLITALSRDGRNDEIGLILRYRLLADLVGGSVYGDTVLAGTGDGVEVETRTGFLDQERLLREAQDREWKSIDEGDIVLHETRQTTRQRLSTGLRAKPANDNTAGAAAPLLLGRGEDAIIARLDATPILRELRAALGPLQAVFEDAALEGATFTAIGEARGYCGKQASAAGRALVYAGVDALSTAWLRIDRRRKEAARSAHAAVRLRRAELAAKRAVNFGLSA